MAKPIVTFDAGASLLKMAVFSAERNRIQLTDFDVSPLSVPPEASLEEKNRILARQMKASLSLKKIKSNSVLVSISGQSVFTRFVKLPAVEEAKVSQIIRYEAQQQVPFPIEDVEWDHNIIGKTPTGEIDIVLVAAKNDVIASLVQECRKAGLEVAVVDVAPLCVYNCLRHAEQEFAECTAVLDFGAKAANLIISEGDDLWARTIPIGGEGITAAIAKELNLDEADAEKLKQTAWVPETSAGEPEEATEQQRKAAAVIGSFINRMFAELSRSVGFYRSQPGHSAIRRILLSGGSSRLRNFKEFVSDRFRVDVGLLSPLNRIATAGSIDRAELNRHADLLAGAVGLGLRGAEMARIRVNLLPKAITRQKELARKKVLLVAAGWLLVASFLALAMGKKIAHGDNSRAFNGLVETVRKTLPGIISSEATLKEQRQELESVYDRDSSKDGEIMKIQGEIQDIEKKVDAIAHFQAARTHWAEFIEELKKTKEEAAGRGRRNFIWLTALRMTNNEMLAMELAPEMGETGRGGSYGPLRSLTRAKRPKKKLGTDTRPYVIISGYVKIPPEATGLDSAPEASRRVDRFKNALEAMGQRFVCTKQHKYREEKDTGILYPVSPDTGPAKAYRYRLNDAGKKVVLEGFLEGKSAEGEENSPPPEASWQVLASYTSRKPPDWLDEIGLIKGDEPVCPICLAQSDGQDRRTCKRTSGYIEDAYFGELKAPPAGERVQRFTIVGRLTEEFYYKEKTEAL